MLVVYKSRIAFFSLILLLLSSFNPSVFAVSQETLSQTEMNKSEESIAADVQTVEDSVYQEETSVADAVYSSKSYLVKLKKGKDKDEFLDKTKLKNHKHKKAKYTSWIELELTNSEVEELATYPEVELIEPNSSVTTLSIGKPDKNNSTSKKVKKNDDTIPWGIHAIGADLVKNDKGKSIKVAVLDTGISVHPDLQVTGGISFVDNSIEFVDDNGHGTHVAGTIAAMDNKLGVVGVAPKVDLYSVKVLDSNGAGTYGQVIQGIEWAIENRMDIVSMSFGGTEQNQSLHDAIIEAANHGILLVGAAGNLGYGTETEMYPARFSEVLSVGAVNKNFRRASYSSTGGEIDLVAPGTDILSTMYDMDYGTLSGTSMAAPHITGAAAALWSKNKKLTADQIKAKLYESATPINNTNEYGHGLVNLAKALGVIDHAIAPIEEVSEFNINEWDVRTLNYANKLDELREIAKHASFKELASEIEESSIQLNARSKNLHVLPDEFTAVYTKEESFVQTYDINEYYRLSQDAFIMLETDYQSAVETFQSILANPIAGTTGITANDLGIQQTTSTVVDFPETLDNAYNRSRSINIPYLTKVDSVITNNGTVSYTVNGTNVTITAGGGSPTRTAYNPYKFSQPISVPVYRDTLAEFPATWPATNTEGYAGAIPKAGDPVAYTGTYTPEDSKLVNIAYWGNANTVFPSYKIYNQDSYSGTLYITGSKYQTSKTEYGFRDSMSSSGFPSYIMFDDGSYNGALYLTGSSFVVSGSYTPGSSMTFTNSCQNTVVNIFKYGVLQSTSSGSCPSSYYINSDGYVGYIPQTGTQLTYNSGSCSSTVANCTQTKTYTASYSGSLSKSASDTRIYRQNYRGTVYSYNYYQNYNGTVVRPEMDTRKWLQTYSGNIYKAGTDNFYSYKATVNATTTPPDTRGPSTPSNLSYSGVTSSTVNLAWGLSIDAETSVNGYNIYKNGVLLQTSINNNTQITNLSPNTIYQFSVRAFDIAGNLSSSSNSITVSIPSLNNVTAPILTAGNSVDVDLQAGGFNVYRFIPVSTGKYVFMTGPFGGVGGNNDTYLELFSDSNLKTRVAYNDDDSGTVFSKFEVTLTAGTTYFLSLRGYSPTVAIHARLSVAMPQPIIYQDIILDTPIDVDAIARSFKAFKFIPATTGAYKINTNYYGGDSSAGINDTYLEIYSDAEMTNLLASNDDSNGTYFSQIIYTMTAGKPYYIKLRHYGSSAVHARVAVSSTITSFISLNLNENSVKSINTAAGTNAYFSFTAPSSGLYRFFTSSYQGIGPNNDTIIHLYRDQYLSNELVFNNDIEDNPYGANFSKVEFSLTAGSTYYVKLEPGNSASGLNTNLTVEQDSDGTRGLATPVGWEQIYTNQLSSMFDVDYFRVDVSEPTEVHLNITSNKVILQDTIGNRYGIFLPGNTESFTLPTAGVYYAKVEYYNDSAMASALSINGSSNKTMETVSQSVYVEGMSVANDTVSQSVYSEDMSIANVSAQAISSYYISNKQSNVTYGSEESYSQSTNSYLDGTNTKNYANINYSYWDSHNSTIIQIKNQFGILVYEETVGYRAGRYMTSGGYPAPSVYSFKWKGNLNRNTQLAVPYDTDWDTIPDKNLANNGIYYVIITPTDAPGSSHPTIVSINVVNDSNYLTRLIPAPPRTMENGTTITSKNKGKCDTCWNYFIKYVWDRGGSSPSPQLTQYDYWSKGIYGLNGLEKFWVTTESFIYNPNETPMDNLQRLIGYGGFIPVLGAGPDGLNTILYLARGQEINAGLSLVGMIPFYGDSILGVKLFKQIYRFNPCNCFAAGTQVSTKDGKKPIERVVVGDLVWSKNTESGEQAYKRVEAVYEREASETWNIYVNNEVLTTTDFHPFWIIGKGWVYAKDLKIGDQLESASGKALSITNVLQRAEEITLYNFSVEDFHTYYVSNLDILTHNATCIPASVYEAQVSKRVKSTLTGSSDSVILGKELNQAGLYPDVSDGNVSSWQAHHIVPAGATVLPEAQKARELLNDKFKIDVNAAANGVWLPKVKGETFYRTMDWENISVELATHNGRHTDKYFSYVYQKLNEAYVIYGPAGINLSSDLLQAEGVKVLHSIRKDLIEGKIALGKVK